MRYISLFLFALIVSAAAQAQNPDSAAKASIANTRNMPRSGDHLMIQLGYLSWSGAPDSINTSGLPRTANVYLLNDFPFKGNRKMSVAIGVGIGTDHMFFDETVVGIRNPGDQITFRNAKGDTSYFKKTKLHTAYLEAPIELRFSSNPNDAKRSIKAALGVKVGTLLTAAVKGKELRDKNGALLNDYKSKEYSKRFFNAQRVSATARFGIGSFTAFASYQLTPLFDEGKGPQVRPLSFGITLSGL